MIHAAILSAEEVIGSRLGRFKPFGRVLAGHHIGLDAKCGNEDVVDYMEYIKYMIGAWHSKRNCPETTLEYMKLPVSNDKPIGMS